MSRMRVLLVVLLVLVAAAVAVALKMRGTEDEGIRVETETVGRMEIIQSVTATGRIQPKTQVNISADVSAKITRLFVEEGQWIERGTLLLELDRERYSAAVESAEANLRVTQANGEVVKENMIKSEKDWFRTNRLHEEGLETQAQLDSAHATFQAETARRKAALDQVEQARALLKQAQDDQSKTRIYAPMNGTISRLNKERGEIALGSQFQEDVIMEISNLEGMEALVDVDENDIVSLALTDKATIEVDALPGEGFEGTVTEIANSAKISASGTSDQKTEFEVKVAVINPRSNLRPGMTATADIVTEVRENAIGIPIQAVAVRTLDQLKKGDDSKSWEPDKDGFVELVFVVEGNTVQARQVQSGIQSETHIEIVEGLEPGEIVVIGDYRAISRDLEDGSEVVLPTEDDAAGETG